MDVASVIQSLDGGRVPPSKLIQILMSKQKQKGYSRSNVAKPFQYNKLKNPSEFIQNKYGNPNSIKPFDYCKAQQRKQQDFRDSEEYPVAKLMINEKLTAEEAIKKYNEQQQQKQIVFNPQYWGLSWDELTPVGDKYYVNKDGLRFPPIQWRNPADGKSYWGLACCGAEPRDGKKKQRYKMIYFRDETMPTIDASFGQTAVKSLRKLRRNIIDKKDDPKSLASRDEIANQRRSKEGTWTTGIVKDTKKYDGVTLEGTNQVLARPDVVKKKEKVKKPTAEDVKKIKTAMEKVKEGRVERMAELRKEVEEEEDEEEDFAPETPKAAATRSNVVSDEERAEQEKKARLEAIRERMRKKAQEQAEKVADIPAATSLARPTNYKAAVAQFKLREKTNPTEFERKVFERRWSEPIPVSPYKIAEELNSYYSAVYRALLKTGAVGK